MNVIVFGATGMIGQGVLRECLRSPAVERVLTVGRTVTGQKHAKLTEIAHGDLGDYTSIEASLTGWDACLFCLGVSASGMSEADYTRITYEVTLAAARTLARLNPAMTFLYVSGAGTDSTEKGRAMWARVKGRTENALLALPFRAAYMFRPGIIQPLDGIRSRTPLYRTIYRLLGWLFPVARALAPRHVLTTRSLGRAMLAVARDGAPARVLEAPDIHRAAGPEPE